MNTAKLAEEYAQQTFDKNDPRYPQLVQDFKDVIEKAYQAGVDGMADWNKANSPRAARASKTNL